VPQPLVDPEHALRVAMARQ